MLGRGLVLAGLVVVLDQLAKWYLLTEVMRPPHVITVTPFFDIVLHWNPGISFGLFNSTPEVGPWLLVVVALAITAALVVWLRRVESPLLAVGIGLVIGGAVGNVIDRVRFGAVVDFLVFHAYGFHWPAFNLADTAITVGVGLVIIDALFTRPVSRK